MEKFISLSTMATVTLTRKRQFHKNKTASYLLPNDQDETARLFRQHNMLFKFLNGNYLAPIEQDLEKGITVLDSGCGPGVWTTDMAKTYPNSTFHGIDISSVVPERWKLRNTIYTTGNISEGLPYQDNYFDYIHQRLLILGLKRNDWANSMRNFYKALKPGGYIEFLEVRIHGYDASQPLFKELTDTFYKMMVDYDMLPNINDELGDVMKDAGFVNITIAHKEFTLDYEKEEGRKQCENFFGVSKGCASQLIKYNDNWNDLDDFDKHMKKMRREILKMKFSRQYAIVYGQKPF